MTFYEEVQAQINRMTFDNPEIVSNGLVNGGTGRCGEYIVVTFPGQSIRVFAYKNDKFSVSRCLDEKANGEISETAARAFFELWFEMMW